MVFSSQFFLYLFLPALMILYFPIGNITWRNSVLLAFSLLFYACGEPKYVILLIAMVAINYVAGLLMSRCRKKAAQRLCLTLALIANLGILAYYKYFSWLAGIFVSLTGLNWSVPQVAMPLGISFFTFQAMSYTVDVFRKKVKTQKSFLRLLLYVSFFPQLVSGPIVQYGDIDLQLSERHATVEEINEGIFRFACGLGRKVLIADACDKCVTMLLGQDAASCSVLGTWIGVLFFALQIYFDFSGYSDMAIGLGHIFGFTFKENFNYPYLSLSATDFWRRWHISLGSFFREYLYIPLGGNRSHEIRNLLIVWFLTGLWHGAAWNFVAWGLYYGILILIEKKLLFPILKKIPTLLSRAFSVVYIFLVTMIGWTIFYFDKGIEAFSRIGMMFGDCQTFFSASDQSVLRSNLWLLVAALVLSFPICSTVLRKIGSLLPSDASRQSVARVAKTVFIVAVIFLSTAMLTGNDYSPFLYERF